MLSQQVSWSPRVIIYHGLTCIFILWLIAIDIDDNFAQGAMVYTTAAMNYHKELYHVRGGKKAIRETRLVQLYMFFHMKYINIIYIYMYATYFWLCNLNYSPLILCWGLGPLWGHEVAKLFQPPSPAHIQVGTVEEWGFGLNIAISQTLAYSSGRNGAVRVLKKLYIKLRTTVWTLNRFHSQAIEHSSATIFCLHQWPSWHILSRIGWTWVNRIRTAALRAPMALTWCPQMRTRTWNL